MILQLHDYADLALPYILEMDQACDEAKYSQLKLFVQICAESAWNANATSPTGAIGLCQIEPATASDWACDPSDPFSAMRAMAHNMAIYETQFGSFELALAAYNAGDGAVRYYDGIPPYAETQEYCETIAGTVSHAAKFWPAFYEGLLAQAKALEPDEKPKSFTNPASHTTAHVAQQQGVFI